MTALFLAIFGGNVFPYCCGVGLTQVFKGSLDASLGCFDLDRSKLGFKTTDHSAVSKVGVELANVMCAGFLQMSLAAWVHSG